MIRIAIVAVQLGLLGGIAAAQHVHQHPPQHAALHDQFYKTWMMPDDRKRSCCSDRDCAPTLAVRRGPKGWEGQRESDGEWLEIPPDKVEYDRDSPDGRAHMCSAGKMVFCFIVGSGG